jgi:hypothetical protein
MSSLLLLNRVYILEIQSVMLASSTCFVNYCLRQIKHLPQSPFTDQFFLITTFGFELNKCVAEVQPPGNDNAFHQRLLLTVACK